MADQINSGALTFEDKGLDERDEPDETAYASYEYSRLRNAILDQDVPHEERRECVEELKELAEDSNPDAQYLLGKLYRDGGLLIPNNEKAEKWFRRSAEDGNDCAAYALGKLCLDGKLVRQNVALGMRYMEQAAQMGHAFAQFFIDRQDSLKPPSLMLAVTRLLHYLGGIFETSRPLDATSRPIEIDRKRFAELQEKRIAMGHKPDVASGIILGAAIAAPAAGAALTAQQSSQKITVDGKPVQIEAYSINGNNYAKLRDVGKAVGFAVEYDAATNTVQISTKNEYKEDNVSNGLRTVVLPTDGSQYIPQVGDLIPCDDGTTYEVKDVVRWDSNVFAEGPLPPLPTPTCNWSAFPKLELPEPIVKHYNDKHGNALFVRNVYEVRRMVYTIYNAIGEEPEAWRDSKPLCKIFTEIPLEYEPYTGVF